MIAYLKCDCPRYRLLAKKLQAEGYEVRFINMNPEWRKEAREFHMKFPFTVVDGVVAPL